MEESIIFEPAAETNKRAKLINFWLRSKGAGGKRDQTFKSGFSGEWMNASLLAGVQLE